MPASLRELEMTVRLLVEHARILRGRLEKSIAKNVARGISKKARASAQRGLLMTLRPRYWLCCAQRKRRAQRKLQRSSLLLAIRVTDLVVYESSEPITIKLIISFEIMTNFVEIIEIMHFFMSVCNFLGAIFADVNKIISRVPHPVTICEVDKFRLDNFGIVKERIFNHPTFFGRFLVAGKPPMGS